ncbi:FIP (Fungus-Induced Protein) Related [Caenorhabditis elegans]|uniref:FIP (Fungus-Induced Protein) Related n=1 Tax=Caenorhabditis elegans TaxID=6239 RepID=Q8MPU7_CAEEL|nr:FIP (Fungus-Induced Protein) Related [Caenorhabditis elegans]CCD62475.1 FIP (Fungus-Induced Protein) Related [Caenorhabditis elegans]|eukprot:NP_740849.1 Uncharacterized protein CELE_F48C1.9 [Caenorhabditis elegans]
MRASISTFFLILLAVAITFNVAQAQLSTAAKVGLTALGGAVVDRTFFRQPANNYYYSYPGYNYYQGKKRK